MILVPLVLVLMRKMLMLDVNTAMIHPSQASFQFLKVLSLP
jgi:hypothetical protein